MKRFLCICAAAGLVYACKKETDMVYDSHLFRQLQAKEWVFDSLEARDSAGNTTRVYPPDTAKLVTQFNSQQYMIRTVKDTGVVDSVIYQAIYDNPDKIYYNYPGGQVVPGQYLTIDTVNEQQLRLIRTDTSLLSPALLFYHAQ